MNPGSDRLWSTIRSFEPARRSLAMTPGLVGYCCGTRTGGPALKRSVEARIRARNAARARRKIDKTIDRAIQGKRVRGVAPLVILPPYEA